MELPVTSAAARLGVDDSRVRKLLRDGVLPGRQVGRLWLIRSEDLALLESRQSRPGRPLAPARAWGLLDFLDEGRAPWLSPVARSQTKQLLRGLAGANADRWRAALRARSEILRCRSHPAAIKKLLAQPGVLPAGDGEAARRGIDLVVVDGMAQAYVPREEWPVLSERLMINELANEPNLIVMLPRDVWPFEAKPEVTEAALAADLLDSAEPRGVNRGVAVLNELSAPFKGAA